MQNHPVPGAELPFEGARNFRELGGWPAAGGKTVRWGLFYRGPSTADLTSPADRALLDSLNLKLILDLRSTSESRKAPDLVPQGTELIQQCALCANDGHEIGFSPEDIALLRQAIPAEAGEEGFLQGMYLQMLQGNRAYRILFQALEAGRTPLLFHCTAGKDRTGVAAMLILLALGTPDEAICTDFALTNHYRRAAIEAYVASHAAEIAADPACERYYQWTAGVNPELAPFVLDTIRTRWGSAEAYLEAEYGLDSARLERLRQMYTE